MGDFTTAGEVESVTAHEVINNYPSCKSFLWSMVLKSTTDDRIYQQGYFCNKFYGNCRTVFEKISVSIHRKSKKCHYDSEGDRLTAPESNLVKCQGENKKDFLEKG